MYHGLCDSLTKLPGCSPLWPLLEIDDLDDDALLEVLRSIYRSHYVVHSDGTIRTIRDWQGRQVKFHLPTFDHAFSEASDYRRSAGVHDVRVSRGRAKRILWIREVITASKGTIEVLAQTRIDSRGRTRQRRTLLVTEECYVVVLQKTERKSYEFEFVTAFQADESYVKKIRSDSTLVEIKKPQTSGD